jgi:transcriptional regulator with XRE-family HTH domain
MPADKKLTVKDVADRLGASRSTITLWCRLGRFPNARKMITPFGDHWEIPEKDLSGVEIKMGRPRKHT